MGNIESYTLADLPARAEPGHRTDRAKAALAAGEEIIVQGIRHRPCQNFTRCSGTVPKPATSTWPTICTDCKLEADAARQWRKREVKRLESVAADALDVPEWPYAPQGDDERWMLARALDGELYTAWLKGHPFNQQLPIWIEELRVLRSPHQSQYASPRPCHHALSRGTLIWNQDDCPVCGHLQGPQHLRVLGGYEEWSERTFYTSAAKRRD